MGEGSLVDATLIADVDTPCATVDMTTDGVEDTTAVTATVLEIDDDVELLLPLLLLVTREAWDAVITTGGF